MLSLPPHLRRGLLQQHVLHRTQIQPSRLVLGLQPCREPPGVGTGRTGIIYNTDTPSNPAVQPASPLVPRRKLLF